MITDYWTDFINLVSICGLAFKVEKKYQQDSLIIIYDPLTDKEVISDVRDSSRTNEAAKDLILMLAARQLNKLKSL